MSAPRVVGVVALLLALLGAFLATRSCGDPEPEKHGTTTRADGRSAGSEAETPQRAVPARAAPPRAERAPDAAGGPAVAGEATTPEHLEGGTGVSIEVVDESGVPVVGATVGLEFADLHQYAKPGVDVVLPLTVRKLAVTSASALLIPLPEAADGIALRAFATAEGFATFAGVEFTVRAGHVENVRLVAGKPRTADVLVVDAATDRPVPQARVVSTTEAARRSRDGLDAEEARFTGADGRCRLVGLGPGPHEIEVHADGYSGNQGTWTDGEFRIRLEPNDGACTVTGRVLGPDGAPVPNVRVNLVGTDRVARTDAGGRATFTGVDPGITVLTLDPEDWEEASASWKELVAKPQVLALLETDVGGTHEVVLGIVPAGTGSIEGRLVDEDGAPIAGATVKVFDVGNAEAESVTDTTGNVRFVALPKGNYLASIGAGAPPDWYLHGLSLGEGEQARVTWTLGAFTIRGRVVAGPERRGVGGVLVWFRGHANGVARSRADGTFELRRARAGTYSIEAVNDDATATKQTVTVPSEGDVVVELVAFGRIALRFRSEDREKLRAAVVFLRTDDDGLGPPMEPGTGDDDLVAAQVRPGRYEVEVIHDDHRRRFPVDVVSGKTTVVEVGATGDWR